MPKSVINCIKIILQWNIFSRLTTCSPRLGKQTKAIFASGWFIRMVGWKKEMVDAFIKYGNLLNGLWQSHWRSLFRCRWLPPYWLPLSLVELPVREKRRKLPPAFTDWQSITTTACLYMRLTDCLSTLPLNRPLAHTISPSLCINSPLMQQKANKPSLSWAPPCAWRHRAMHTHGCHGVKEKWEVGRENRSKTMSMFHYMQHHITQKNICHS